MFAKAGTAALLAWPLLGAAQPDVAQQSGAPHAWTQACELWDDWDKPGPAFNLHGNTWYVGTCGIAAILITSNEGHVLIDSGTEAGADVVLANIRSLGLDPQDIQILLNSHEHFDHVGGMAKLQKATGGDVISSDIGIYVLVNGTDHPADPQYGMHEPMQRITHGKPYYYANAPELLERFGMTPHPTPGHTPGAMSWSWKSCETDQDCIDVVYADSMSPVSSDTYRFSDDLSYVAHYLDALSKIEGLPCDMLITPHPSASDLHGLLQTRSPEGEGAKSACAEYASSIRTRLSIRLAKEAEAK